MCQMPDAAPYLIPKSIAYIQFGKDCNPLGGRKNMQSFPNLVYVDVEGPILDI